MSGFIKKGRKFTDNDWIHVSIWVKPSEWERLNYLASASGKSLSTWLVDEVLAMGTTPVVHRAKIRNEQGCSKSLCVDSRKWEIIKERAESNGMNITKYVLACVLKDE